MEIFTIGFWVCMACGLACFYLFFIKKRIMYTALFIVGLIMFCYLCYVLIKPEKF